MFDIIIIMKCGGQTEAKARKRGGGEEREGWGAASFRSIPPASKRINITSSCFSWPGVAFTSAAPAITTTREKTMSSSSQASHQITDQAADGKGLSFCRL